MGLVPLFLDLLFADSRLSVTLRGRTSQLMAMYIIGLPEWTLVFAILDYLSDRPAATLFTCLVHDMKSVMSSRKKRRSACDNCHKAKVRCSGETTCSRCEREYVTLPS